MYIKELTVSKLRNVLRADLQFSDRLVKISGDNGAGKSTIVDGIRFAILGKVYIGRGRSAESLITQGENKAEIEVTLEGNGKKLKIKRGITASGNTTLDIRSSEGDKLQQKDLDLLLSEFTIDPLEFLRFSKKEQVESIKNLIGIDTTEIDKKISNLEQDRTNKNAIYTEYKKTVENFGEVKEVQRVDMSQLVAKKDEMVDVNNRIQTLEHNIAAVEDDINKSKDLVQELEAKIQREKEKISDNYSLLEDFQNQYNELEHKDITSITEQIASADETNRQATRREQFCEKKEQLKQHEKSFNESKDELEKARQERKEMITSAKLPIEGLEFSEDDGIIISGIPLDQYSSAEQLVIACKIATVRSPELKVIYIKDGSLLDGGNLKLIDELAEKEGYQIFVERVGEELDSIIMREGEVFMD